MGKIIIDNRSSISDAAALNTVIRSIEAGRISNNGKQYCYVCVMETHEGTVQVASDLNKCSDKFTIVDEIR